MAIPHSLGYYHDLAGKNCCKNDRFYAIVNVMLYLLAIFGLFDLIKLDLNTLSLSLQVHRYYRASGGTLDKAAAEAAKGAAGNKYVRDAVKGGVKAGVSATLSAASEDK